MTRICTDYWDSDIEECLSLGYSTKYIAKQLGIPEKVLIRVIQQKRQERNKWQAKIDKEYNDNNTWKKGV